MSGIQIMSFSNATVIFRYLLKAYTLFYRSLQYSNIVQFQSYKMAYY